MELNEARKKKSVIKSNILITDINLVGRGGTQLLLLSPPILIPKGV